MPSDKTIGRLSLYRRLLQDLQARRVRFVFSHQLATLAGVSAAQARRDVMEVGYNGSPRHGYEVDALAAGIAGVLDAPAGDEAVVLVGMGNLGRAIVTYFRQRRPRLKIVAAFDTDPEKAGRVLHGCRCYPLTQLQEITREHGVRTAILAVPAEVAQDVAYALVNAGVRGMLNFAPRPLKVPDGVYVENFDMTVSLEKVAYFARQ